MPELSALHAMRSNIEVVGLAYEDIEVPEMQSFLTKHPVTYPIVIVDPFDPPADFATPRGLPLTHLLDPQGKLAHTFLGPGDRRRHRKADRGCQVMGWAAACGPAPGSAGRWPAATATAEATATARGVSVVGGVGPVAGALRTSM